MDRQTIIDEIRRIAAENGGTPLGVRRLDTEAGIKSALLAKVLGSH
jgi:hypothetical protein